MAQDPPFFIHVVICCFAFVKLTNMYKCEKHGKLDSHWCEECQELCACDCSELTETRFKDLIIDCEDGEQFISNIVLLVATLSGFALNSI